MSRYKFLIFGVMVLAGAVYLAPNFKSLRLPPCMFYEVTGLYCPGCGSTRAVLRLIQGDLLGALRANIVLFTLGPFVLFLAGAELVSSVTSGRVGKVNVPNWAGYVVVVVLAVYWVIRNIPLHPFTLLAPR